jgi:hypothetical protein
MKYALLTAAFFVALAGTASATTESYDSQISLSRGHSALPNDCVNRTLAMECPLTDMGKNDPSHAKSER